MSLTKKQAEGIQKLVAMQPFVTVQKYGQTMISTGLNTTVLHSLRDLGYISCTHVWLRGNTSPDLKVLKTETPVT